MKKKKSPSTQQQVSKTSIVVNDDFLDRLDQFFFKHKKLFLYITLILSTLFSLLLFNPQISESGDDSAYIERAYSFLHDGVFPSFQGPLYPMVLSIFVALFGVKLFWLKLFSLVFVVGSLYFFYKAFENIISPFILFVTILMLSTCSSLLFYSSQTFTEAFFMLLQSIVFYILLQKIDVNKDYSLRKDWGKFLLLGGFVFLLGITKNIAIIAIVPIVGYFLFEKKWKHASYTIGFYAVCYFIFSIVKKFIFHASSDSSQFKMLLAKHPYNKGLGQETFQGFIVRFFENMDIYFNYLYGFLNLKATELTDQPIVFLTVLVCILLIVLFYFVLKQKQRIRNVLLFSLSYIVIMSGSSFIILQTLWRQDRLILVFYPIFLLLCLLAFYYLFKQKKLKQLQWIILVFLAILFLVSLKKTMVQVQEKRDVLFEAMNDNDLYTYTMDWQNYLTASRWVATNLPDTVQTACRKSSMSFIISGGKKNMFYGIYGVPDIPIKNIISHIDTNKNKILTILVDEIPIELRDYILAVSTIPTIGDSVQNFFICSVPQNVSYNQTIVISFDKWYSQNQSKTPMFYCPDSLMNTLRENNVQYVLMANLLINPKDEQNSSIINTLHRYFSYIQVKYPFILDTRPLYSVGNARNGSVVLKINYPPQL